MPPIPGPQEVDLDTSAQRNQASHRPSDRATRARSRFSPLHRWRLPALVLAALAAVIGAATVTQGTAKAQSLPGNNLSFIESLRKIDDRPIVPDIAFKDANGRDWGFVEFRGQVVVAVFWATWCPICYGEMPKLDRLQAELGGEGIQVLALSQDEQGVEAVKRYYARREIRHLRIHHDPGAVLASILGIRGVPTSFVIDPAGRMVGVVEGPADWNSVEARNYLQELRN